MSLHSIYAKDSMLTQDAVHVEEILSNWNLKILEDVFPDSIRPSYILHNGKKTPVGCTKFLARPPSPVSMWNPELLQWLSALSTRTKGNLEEALGLIQKHMENRRSAKEAESSDYLGRRWMVIAKDIRAAFFEISHPDYQAPKDVAAPFSIQEPLGTAAHEDVNHEPLLEISHVALDDTENNANPTTVSCLSCTDRTEPLNSVQALPASPTLFVSEDSDSEELYVPSNDGESSSSAGSAVDISSIGVPDSPNGEDIAPPKKKRRTAARLSRAPKARVEKPQQSTGSRRRSARQIEAVNYNVDQTFEAQLGRNGNISTPTPTPQNRATRRGGTAESTANNLDTILHGHGHTSTKSARLELLESSSTTSITAREQPWDITPRELSCARTLAAMRAGNLQTRSDTAPLFSSTTSNPTRSMLQPHTRHASSAARGATTNHSNTLVPLSSTPSNTDNRFAELTSLVSIDESLRAQMEQRRQEIERMSLADRRAFAKQKWTELEYAWAMNSITREERMAEQSAEEGHREP